MVTVPQVDAQYICMQTKANIIERIITVAKEYGATRLILFGSYADNPSEAHDIDLACDGIQGWKLYEFAGHLENELQILLDIVALTPSSSLTQRIESEGTVLL